MHLGIGCVLREESKMKKKLIGFAAMSAAIILTFSASACSGSGNGKNGEESPNGYSAETATDMAITLPVPSAEASSQEGASSEDSTAASGENMTATGSQTEETTSSSGSESPAAQTSEATPDATTEASGTGNVAANSKYDPQTQKLIALTFDDGPDTGNTNATTRIVDVMEKYGAHCTFFAVGEAIKEWFPTSCVDVMKKAINIGCEYGTHTYSHANLNKLDAEGINNELSRGISAIENITGQKVTLLRPPYGNAAENVQSAVDMPMIQWDVDTLDWDTKDAANTLRVVQENIKPGSIVLMHDIYRQTADAVESMVPWLQENGYTLVTVTELFEAYGIPLEGHKQYYSTDTIK
jgi:peptidoglycan/xylan/chitin deacetylase (PgdA/CDA1 family)